MSLPTQYQNFIHLSRYSRWLEEQKRRENWDETVARYIAFFDQHLSEKCNRPLLDYEQLEIFNAIHDLKSMPSMRALMTAGKALARDNVAGYNCAYRPIDTLRAFDEIMYILMCGTGVGYSVERQIIDRLPIVSETFVRSGTVIVVRDSKLGWSEALRELIALLYSGMVPSWDLSRLRAAGTRLKTMGGRASGPEPLDELFHFVVNIITQAAGRKLTSIECHDLVCKIADIVVVGGVRRSAMLSLSNLSDQRMRDAKMGQWWDAHVHRTLANNSIAYTERPDVGQFMQEWVSLYESKSGERGIFNREAAINKVLANGRRKAYWDDEMTRPIDFGTNPCSEILLRPYEFCNLTEIVAREDDTLDTLTEKARIAAIMGTMQSTLTDFRYIGKKWKNNCDEERLLGVSITGIMDCPLINGTDKEEAISTFIHLRNVVIDTNREWAEELGINQSTAATCVKPSGTASQLVLSGSGVHAWHAPKYIRNVRNDIKDPLAQFMIDQGFPYEMDVTKPDETVIFKFPIEAPENAICRDDRTAIEELEHWKLIQDHWCEHKPSVTITVREHEWPEVGGWVWNNFDSMSGVSFLPHTDHIYRQAPYETVDDEMLEELKSQVPQNVDWSKLSEYESEDNTSGTREFACTANACEIVGDG